MVPILPRERGPGPKGGRPRVSNRQVFTGNVFVLRTGVPWQRLPLELGCGSGSTCWRRVRSWTRRGLSSTVARAQENGAPVWRVISIDDHPRVGGLRFNFRDRNL